MCPAARIAVPFDPAGGEPAWALAAEERAPFPEAVRAHLHDVRTLSPCLFEEWTTLAQHASEPNCFAEAWFADASLAAFGGKRALRLAEVRRQGRLIGAMLLSVEQGYAHLPVHFVQNWCHHHSFLGTPLIRRGEEKLFWLALLEALDAADWAPNFLHLRWLEEDGPVHRGLVEAAAARGGGCATVYRRARALLECDGDPEAYYHAAVGAKRRKEIRRQQNRLAELGQVGARLLGADQPVGPWCDEFLALEKAGWKGEAGSALACDPATEAFFRRALAGAHAAGRLRFRRLDLDGRPLAMLVNFLAPPGGFSFKTCYDPEYARFSPGVLLQLENLNLLRQPEVEWMDSCAIDHHPMIESLWKGRRTVVRVTVRLGGLRRGFVHAAARALETGSAIVRAARGGAGA